jgi:peptidyl-prolyl cis-trans isomerase SurA
MILKKLVLLFLLTISSSFSYSQKEIIDRIEATVGDEYILSSEVEEQFSLAKEKQTNITLEYKCNVLESILLQKLMLNQARLDSIEVKNEEVEAQMNERFEQILAYMNGDVNQLEAYYGQSISELKDQTREDMKNQLMVDKMRAKILEKTTVTPAEVIQFFNKIPKDSLPYFNQEVELSEIVMKPKVNAEEKLKSKTRLEEVRTRVVDKGEDFAAIAKSISADVGSGQQGGDLGWAKRGKFVPEFEAAAFNLEDGQYSNVIETEFGFHLIQLLERRGNSIHTRHILIKPELSDDDIALTVHKLDSIRTELIRDSLNFTAAVKRYSDKKAQSYFSGGRLSNRQSGTTIFEARDLDPDIFFAIDTVTIKGITKPLVSQEPTGEKVVKLYKLDSRTIPHKANLSQDFNKIHQATLDVKKNAKILEWIENRVKNTYINMFPSTLQTCPTLQRWTGTKKMVIKP